MVCNCFPNSCITWSMCAKMKDRWCKIMLVMNKNFKILRRRRILNNLKFCLVWTALIELKLRPVRSARYSSHQRWAHSWKSVSTLQLSYFLPHDFANFWSEVRGQNSKTPDTAGFLIKIFLNDPGKKNCIFRWFLDHFSKTTVTILLKSF